MDLRTRWQGALGGRKRASDPLGLGLQKVDMTNMGAERQNSCPLPQQQAPSHLFSPYDTLHGHTCMVLSVLVLRIQARVSRTLSCCSNIELVRVAISSIQRERERETTRGKLSPQRTTKFQGSYWPASVTDLRIYTQE